MHVYSMNHHAHTQAEQLLPSETGFVPKKAGLIIYGYAASPKPVEGKDDHKRMYVLAGFSEGRFLDKAKAYAMPKGSIDRGETPKQAAARETYEETGIDIARLLGEEQLKRWLSGKTITDYASEGYPGVKVLKAEGNPAIEQTYISGYGAQHPTTYYALELEGVEHLRPYLKRLSAEPTCHTHYVRKTSVKHAVGINLPKHVHLVEALRTGKMPAKALHDDSRLSGDCIIDRPSLPNLEAEWLKQHPKANLNQQRDWLEFCQKTKGFNKLSEDLAKLKAYLIEREVIAEDGQALKMDTKDRPLAFYKEGGAILPLGNMLSHMAKVAELSPLYARAMWGEYKGRKRPEPSEIEVAESAQIWPALAFFKELCPMEIGFAATRRSPKRDKLHTMDERVMRAFVNEAGLGELTNETGWQRRLEVSMQPAAGEARTAR